MKKGLKFSEYKKISEIDNKWQFLMWFIKTREFLIFLAFILLIWTATLIINPEIAATIKTFIGDKIKIIF